MVTKKRDSKRPKSRGKNIVRRPERIGYCPEEGFDYKAIGLLKKYISETGKIDSAKRNGISAKCQRSLTTAIKRARHMALLPFASNHNYDTSLLDIGKRNSEKVTNEEVDSNSIKIEDESVSVVKSDDAVEKDSLKDEVLSEEPSNEESEVEDKEKSS
tara:strand:- start:106 stop:579 length:474 start_codon:yes stop_codon:yes gene_type:complete